MQTPTSQPTSSGQAITILPDSTGQFRLLQILDNYDGQPPLTAGQIAEEAPHADSVWGTFTAPTWSQYHPGMILSRYYLPNEDQNLISGNTLSSFQNNANLGGGSWILHGCDINNNPQPTHYAWSGTHFANDVPLDIDNPSVVSYQMAALANFLQPNGYNTVAIDNVVFENYLISPNAILEGTGAQPGWYGCGIYQNGNFVRRYNGPLDNQNDSTFNGDMNNWVAQAQAMTHARGMHVIVNHPPLDMPPGNANEQQLISHIDGMVDENGYTHYGRLLTTTSFDETLRWVEYLQQNHKAALVTDYFCTGSSCSNNPATLTQQQVDWALASYALGNEGGENVYISPHGGGLMVYRSEYSKTYGRNCGTGYQQVSSFVYVRKFTGGLAIVNASGSPFNYTLPAHHYSDIENRAVGGPSSTLSLGGTDAYMLLITDGSNGCT
jgi:hypothetical protein